MGSAETNGSLATGCAEFRSLPQAVTDVNGSQTMGLKTVNSKLYFTDPLKLLVTQRTSRGFPSSANCQWLYNCYNSGGALNGNKCVALDIGVGENCNVVLTTQEYPKISAFSASGLVATKKITGRVDEKGLLAVLPDPILCYKNARYHQKQVYKLSPGGNLILLDWVIAGRIALGEIWDMKSFVSESDVYVDGHLISGDAIILGDQGKHPLKESLQHTKVLGSCVFVGPYFSDLKRTIEKKVHEISGGESDGVTASASVLTQTFCDGVVVKLLATQSTEQARTFFRRLIEDTILWIGGDPLDR